MSISNMTNLSIKNTFAVVAGIVLTLALAFAVAAPKADAAVSLQSFGFKVNDKTSDTIQPGDDYEITVNADVNGGDEVEWFRIRLVDSDGNIVSTDCQAVGRVRDVNDRDITFNTETPQDIPNGIYDVVLLPFGINGEEASNGCDLDHDYPGAQREFSNRLFVDDNEDIAGNSDQTGGSSNNGSNTGGSSSVNDVPAWFTQWLNGGFKTIVESLMPKPLCQEFKTLKGGLVQGQHGAGALQTFLITKGGQSGVITYGATGYFGVQTAQAVSNFQLANNCY